MNPTEMANALILEGLQPCLMGTAFSVKSLLLLPMKCASYVIVLYSTMYRGGTKLVVPTFK